MSKKVQSGILSVVLLTGIIMSLVGAAYLWATPLISKNVDKANVEFVSDFMEGLNNDILYVARTGSTRVLSANFEQASLIVNPVNNQVVVEVSSSVPMVGSVLEVPLNFYELAVKREEFNLNASFVDDSIFIEGYDSVSRYNSVLIDGVVFNASLFKNVDSGVFDLLCLWENEFFVGNCSNVGESILIDGVGFEVVYINNSGFNALFLGDLVENRGVFGIEPSGIFSAKGYSVGDKEYITFYLTFRGLVNEDGVVFKIFIDCKNNCVLSNERKSLSISRENVLRQEGVVHTFINIEVV